MTDEEVKEWRDLALEMFTRPQPPKRRPGDWAVRQLTDQRDAKIITLADELLTARGVQ